MQKKLTISISEEAYRSLHAKVGAGKISRFIDRLARAHLSDEGLRDGYAAMAADDARERQAVEWTECLTAGDDEAR